MKLHERITRLLAGDQSAADEHGRSVAAIAVRIAAALGFDEADRERVRLAATVHDIGKRSIPKKILAKPGPLDEAEWEEVRRHPEHGAQMLAAAGLAEIAPWVRAHHERPDGCGYPERLSGDQIPLGARILAVADAYDAMVSNRPYSAAISDRQACAELRAGVGRQFDAGVVAAFMRVRSQSAKGARPTLPMSAAATGAVAVG